MNKREFAKLKKWADTLTDEQLKKEYYDAVFNTLGSQAEEMYERGYDIADVREREKYERWLVVHATGNKRTGGKTWLEKGTLPGMRDTLLAETGGRRSC